MSEKGSSANYHPGRPNAWGFLRDVIIASMNKGQLLGLAIFLILLVYIWRYPEDKLPDLFDKFIHFLEVNKLLGWSLFGLSIFASFLLTKWQRGLHNNEIKRISAEKTNLQQQSMGGSDLPSSKN